MNENGTFFVLFCHSKISLFRRFLKKGFGHVVLAAYCNECLFLFEKRTYLSVMEAHHVKDVEEAIGIMLTTSNLNILASVSPDWETKRWIRCGFMPHMGTCISLIKMMMGVRIPWVFTPHQLFKYLKKTNKLVTIHTNMT